MFTFSTRAPRAAIAVLAGVLLSVSAPMAAAHDVVINSNPADKSTVTEFPRDIVLEFSGAPKDNFNTVAVSNEATGQVLFSETPKLDGRKISVAVPENVTPGAGSYKIGFQITSSDGHATRGMTTFKVAGDSAQTGESAPAGTASTSNDSDSVVLSSESPHSPNTYLAVGIGIIVAVIGALAGIVLLIAKKRK
ncbi:copper resistance protein CopC [Staphylococcus chromogenes]|nr:copper resistance protein CopC [Staphylococcus chromogenes]